MSSQEPKAGTCSSLSVILWRLAQQRVLEIHTALSISFRPFIAEAKQT
jgi:hypothetical protein